MILRPNSHLRREGALSGSAACDPASAVSGWLRRAASDAGTVPTQGVADIATVAGAAIGMLDSVVRRQERWAGAWRHRLALTAAGVTARQAGRVEDEPALRDAVLLTRPGDDVGPAGRMLLAWRRLAARLPTDLLTEKYLVEAMEDFGHACDAAAVEDLVDELRQVSTSAGLAGIMTGAFMAAERHGCPRAIGAWLADALLAQRLGWEQAMPLFGGEVAFGEKTGWARRVAHFVVPSGSEADSDRAKTLLAMQARAALRAIDLSAELGRRANKLLAVAPGLRARASDIVVAKILSEDATVPSQKIAGMSDRGLRRLFDRLVELGAVRELSGRATFRIYGL